MSNGKPFLKWAGGKRQLIPVLEKFIPKTYTKYIEPFLGGAAMFFHIRPKDAILADSNEELINTYRVVKDNVDELIVELENFINDEQFYYQVRSWRPEDIDIVKRAARIIYLNKTGFNGLYRVNKNGGFNVPFGKRVNPIICDKANLLAASETLQGAELIVGDYKDVLHQYASPNDFVFLDPPYHPVSQYADFKRFTKEQFYDDDHIELRDEFARLVDFGCWTLLTNSNTEFIRNLYKNFNYKVVNTKRNISSNSNTRTGEDLIVIETRPVKKSVSKMTVHKSNLLEHFPGTRFMGSKYRILPELWESLKDYQFNSVLDAFSGSSCVSYMFKQQGKQVLSNDFMHFSYHFSKALIENSHEVLSSADLEFLLRQNNNNSHFVSKTFHGLYFSEDDNNFLDSLRANIDLIDNQYKKSLALAAISRACMKRRARGIFTYVGERYDDGRKDMHISLRQHFIDNVQIFNSAVFDTGLENRAFNNDVFDLDVNADLVYLDPPYYTPNSDNDYTRRYHFVEGLVRNWDGLEILNKTKTKKFRRYDTPFLHKEDIFEAFNRLIEKFRDSIIVLSYSSNSIPDKSDLVGMLKRRKENVNVIQIEHRYSFGNQGANVGNNANKVREYIFIAK